LAPSKRMVIRSNGEEIPGVDGPSSLTRSTHNGDGFLLRHVTGSTTTGLAFFASSRRLARREIGFEEDGVSDEVEGVTNVSSTLKSHRIIILID
jgi:hypothetical protein